MNSVGEIRELPLHFLRGGDNKGDKQSDYGHAKNQGQGRTEEIEARGAQEAPSPGQADGAARLPQTQDQEEGPGGAAAAFIKQ